MYFQCFSVYFLERKVHQLQTIAPIGKRSKPNFPGKRSSSLMEKSRQEAMSSTLR
jgi:hypothetical protein